MKIASNFFCSLLFCLTACGQQTFDDKMQSLYLHTVPLIRASELVRLQAKENFFLLDTRSDAEFRVSRIPGALFLDYEKFEVENVANIPKDAEIVVYCSVGYRSERLGETLQKWGYSNVKNLYGGIFDWKNQGYDVINSINQPTDSVHTYNENWSRWLYKGVKVYE